MIHPYIYTLKRGQRPVRGCVCEGNSTATRNMEQLAEPGEVIVSLQAWTGIGMKSEVCSRAVARLREQRRHRPGDQVVGNVRDRMVHIIRQMHKPHSAQQERNRTPSYSETKLSSKRRIAPSAQRHQTRFNLGSLACCLDGQLRSLPWREVAYLYAASNLGSRRLGSGQQNLLRFRMVETPHRSRGQRCGDQVSLHRVLAID